MKQRLIRTNRRGYFNFFSKPNDTFFANAFVDFHLARSLGFLPIFNRALFSGMASRCHSWKLNRLRNRGRVEENRFGFLIRNIVSKTCLSGRYLRRSNPRFFNMTLLLIKKYSSFNQNNPRTNLVESVKLKKWLVIKNLVSQIPCVSSKDLHFHWLF